MNLKIQKEKNNLTVKNLLDNWYKEKINASSSKLIIFILLLKNFSNNQCFSCFNFSFPLAWFLPPSQLGFLLLPKRFFRPSPSRYWQKLSVMCDDDIDFRFSQSSAFFLATISKPLSWGIYDTLEKLVVLPELGSVVVCSTVRERLSFVEILPIPGYLFALMGWWKL